MAAAERRTRSGRGDAPRLPEQPASGRAPPRSREGATRRRSVPTSKESRRALWATGPPCSWRAHAITGIVAGAMLSSDSGEEAALLYIRAGDPSSGPLSCRRSTTRMVAACSPRCRWSRQRRASACVMISGFVFKSPVFYATTSTPSSRARRSSRRSASGRAACRVASRSESERRASASRASALTWRRQAPSRCAASRSRRPRSTSASGRRWRPPSSAPSRPRSWCSSRG